MQTAEFFHVIANSVIQFSRSERTKQNITVAFPAFITFSERTMLQTDDMSVPITPLK